MTELLKISLPDGSVREMPAGSSPADVAAAIGPGLAKAAIAARVDGELRDLGRPFEGDAELALVTARDEDDALELARHDYAHVLAEAVQALWPGTQITFGPATDDGFYYDVMAPASRDPFSMDDLPAIEEKMREIIKADKPLRREVWTRQQLIDRWKSEGETFKAEWAAELPEGEELTVYWSGEDWLDMCRGPHLPSTGKLDPQAFKLMRVAGAYWRGDQKNAQLTRIYGTGWLNKKQLNAHLTRLEEAAKRDHRKLAREMDLFHLQEEAQCLDHPLFPFFAAAKTMDFQSFADNLCHRHARTQAAKGVLEDHLELAPEGAHLTLAQPIQALALKFDQALAVGQTQQRQPQRGLA